MSTEGGSERERDLGIQGHERVIEDESSPPLAQRHLLCVQGAGCRVQGSGFRVDAEGFRVEG